MAFTPISWVWDESENNGGLPSIQIDRCLQMDGTILYAVRQLGACMSEEGEWEFEPQPSSRDDEFMLRCRFATWYEAASAIEKYCRPGGRFVVRWQINEEC